MSNFGFNIPASTYALPEKFKGKASTCGTARYPMCWQAQ